MRLCGISSRFQLLSPCVRQVTHALLTRPPLSHSSFRRSQSASFDLHVLGTPPAFILSQDQTLMLQFRVGEDSEPYSKCTPRCGVSSARSVVKTCWSKLPFTVNFGLVLLEPCSLNILLRIFKDSCYCSVINVHSVVSCDSLFSISLCLHPVKNYFPFSFSGFSKVLCCFSQQMILYHNHFSVSTTFLFIATQFFHFVFLPLCRLSLARSSNAN